MHKELMVLAMVSIWAWPSFSVKRGTKCLVILAATLAHNHLRAGLVLFPACAPLAKQEVE